MAKSLLSFVLLAMLAVTVSHIDAAENSTTFVGQNTFHRASIPTYETSASFGSLNSVSRPSGNGNSGSNNSNRRPGSGGSRNHNGRGSGGFSNSRPGLGGHRNPQPSFGGNRNPNSGVVTFGGSRPGLGGFNNPRPTFGGNRLPSPGLGGYRFPRPSSGGFSNQRPGLGGFRYPTNGGSGSTQSSNNRDCVQWCQTYHGQPELVCCQYSSEKKGSCPPLTDQCPRSSSENSPHICKEDTECDGGKKCCDDKCLGHKTCKPALTYLF